MRSRAFLLLAALLAAAFAIFVAGCAEFQGDVDSNLPPEVDFVNIHVDMDALPDTVQVDTLIYEYAPVVFWKGSDPDGFIEYYSYADITDAAAIENPMDYMPRIPQEAWVDTIATQAKVYLLSEPGQITEHVFYVRAVDNEGAESAIKYRRFYRSNNPPTIPRIGLTGTDETLFGTRYVVEDTLFSAPAVTNVYPGIDFSWRGTDPDDKALFTIPLEFQAILVKAPEETVFVNAWTDQVEITLVDLQTGFYTLNVWARDDGLTKSVAPARAEFNVIRPTFENNLLVVFESPFPAFTTLVNPPSRENVRAYYEGLLSSVAPELRNVNLNLADGKDVQYYSVEAANRFVPRSLIQQFKLVVFVADHMGASGQWENYVPDKMDVVEDYLRVGGRVWQMGRTLFNTGVYFNLNNGGNLSAIQVWSDFFGVDSLAPPPNPADATNFYQVAASPVPLMRADFQGTQPGLPQYPVLLWDSTKVLENGFNNPFTNEAAYYPDDKGMSGVDRIARSTDATTTQQFVSWVTGSEKSVTDEDSRVFPTGNTTFDNRYDDAYPPTPTNAFVILGNRNVLSVSSIINYTFQQAGKANYEAEEVTLNDNLLLISYDEGDPWSDSDSLQVDYIYSPISIMHLKPVEVRVEGSSGGALRFRTALTSFSYYFVERQGAVDAWTQMLDWFYNSAVSYGD